MVRLLASLLFLLNTLLPDYLVAEEPIVIASSDVAPPKQPQATLSSDGAIHVVFGVGEDVVYCHSTDNGKTFSESKVAFQIPNLALGMRRGPRIAAIGNSLIVSAIGGKQGKGKDGDLVAWRSVDRGQTWQGPAQVNDENASAREGLHAMAASTTGDIWCTWLDLRNKQTEMFASKSSDGGISWSPNQLVYRSPEKSVCECCHPSIAIYDGRVQVLFRNSLRGNRDMYLATVTAESGSPETTSIRLGKEHWKLNACPMDGGMLAIDSKGLISTVWRRGREIFAANADGTEEQFLGFGEQPWVTSSTNGPIAVWSARRDGELMFKTITRGEPQTIAKVARDAVIVAEPTSGKVAYVLWEQSEKGRSSILATRIELSPKQP